MALSTASRASAGTGSSAALKVEQFSAGAILFPPPVLRGRVREGVRGGIVSDTTPSPALPRYSGGGSNLVLGNCSSRRVGSDMEVENLSPWQGFVTRACDVR